MRMLPLLLLLGCARAPAHGVASPLSQSQEKLCVHKVPGDVCVTCHPELAARFRAAGDWCGEHGVPESQCLICHPDLTFTPLAIPAGADYRRIAANGEDVPSLEAHLASGKSTVFDFYADWCAPCRTVDEHLLGVMKQRSDVAVRRVNIGGWDTPLSKRYLTKVSSLPYVIVYDKSGRRVTEIIGLDLKKLDEAIGK
jgi:thiol-disulfide isomerase/thioredoxin